jgi:protein ImuB
MAAKRFVSIWFPCLVTDWMLRRQPALKEEPFVMAITERGRRVVKAANGLAMEKGANVDMVVADCRALVPGLRVMDYDADQPSKLLKAMAEWCIRFTPVVAIDPPDGLLLDASGCTHLWGREEAYLDDICSRLEKIGYRTQAAMADTIGTAWAASHYAGKNTIVASGTEAKLLAMLPAAALRIETPVIEKLNRLGLRLTGSFMCMPRTALRRRFGTALLMRIDQALGQEFEYIEPVIPPSPFQERLPALEPIRAAAGIGVALKELLGSLCKRLERECKGLRRCTLTCFRIDGVSRDIEIGTSRPTRNVAHLIRLFEDRIGLIDPGLGIELFVLDAAVVEELHGEQDALWDIGKDSEAAVAELLDRLAGKTGGATIKRYLPAEHHWPERSVKEAASLAEKTTGSWRTDLPRPVHLLNQPEPIEVTVPIPDYPPMLFRYRGTLHTVKKADGPERIEQEWWIQAGLYRDYYCVENEKGARYWLFRAGDYEKGEPKWFVHGFFA